MDTKTLFKLSYGLYVVGVKNNSSEFGGCVVDALAQVSSGNPPRIAMSCMKDNNTPAMIKEHGEFTISILDANVNPFVLSCFGFQSARDVDKWALVDHEVVDGLPVLTDAVGYLRCKVETVNEFDTHTLFIATVEDAWAGNADEPLIYADYHKILKAPAGAAFAEYKATGKAPNFDKAEKGKGEDAPKAESGVKWVCPLCGYIYDGDVAFEDLPDDWVCPLCGAPKDLFEKQ